MLSVSGLHALRDENTRAIARYFPARLDQVQIDLALNIGNEIVRLADTYAPEEGLRFRARCRIPSKSALVSGVAG
jgi:hypothetical protein